MTFIWEMRQTPAKPTRLGLEQEKEQECALSALRACLAAGGHGDKPRDFSLLARGRCLLRAGLHGAHLQGRAPGADGKPTKYPSVLRYFGTQIRSQKTKPKIKSLSYQDVEAQVPKQDAEAQNATIWPRC